MSFGYITRWLYAVVLGISACGRIDFSSGPVGDGGRRALGDGVVGDGTSDGPPRWHLVQAVDIGSIAPTQAGDLLVIADILLGPTQVTSIVDNAPGGTNAYTAIPNAKAFDSVNDSTLEIWYAANIKAGTTQITVTDTAQARVTGVWEVSGIVASAPLDTAASLQSQPSTLMPVAPPVTTTSTGDFIVAVVNYQDSVDGIAAGNAFTNDLSLDGDGWGHLTSADAPSGVYQAVWFDSGVGGTFCSGAAAFLSKP